MIPHILLDEPVNVMAADHSVGQVHVFDNGLQFAAILFGDPGAEDGGDLIGLADGAIGIEQTFPQPVERRAALKDEVVAEFGLRKEQPVLTACLAPFSFREERGKRGQPFLTASQQVTRCQRIGPFL
jgi:hypothetical protein